MERYNKYLVVKIEDILNFLSDEEQEQLNTLRNKVELERFRSGKKAQQYVCVAADWPMYEIVWGMIEAYVDGKPDELTRLQSELAEARAEIERLKVKQEPVAKVAPSNDGSGIISVEWLLNLGRLAQPLMYGDFLYTAPPDLARLERDNSCLAAKMAELEAELDCHVKQSVVHRAMINELTEQVKVARDAITFAEPVMESHAGPARTAWWKEAIAKLQGVE